MSGAVDRHCIPGLTMSTALTGTSLQSVRRPFKTMHTGFSVRIALCQRPGAEATEETGRYDLTWKDLM